MKKTEQETPKNNSWNKLLNSVKLGDNRLLTTDDFKGKRQIILNVNNDTNRSKDFTLFNCVSENNEGITSVYRDTVLYSEIIEYIKVNKTLVNFLYIMKINSKVKSFLKGKYVMNYVTKTPYGELYDAEIVFDNNNPTKEVGPLSISFELSCLTSIKLTLPKQTCIQLRFLISNENLCGTL